MGLVTLRRGKRKRRNSAAIDFWSNVLIAAILATVVTTMWAVPGGGPSLRGHATHPMHQHLGVRTP